MKKRIDILTDGTPLDMYPNTKFTLERFNPIFDFGTVQGSKVFRFTVPFSPVNNKKFQYAGDAQSVADPRVYFTEKIADGDTIERGYTYLEKITSTGYEISFGSNFGDFFSDYQNTPLNLIPFGSEALPASLATMPGEKLDAGKLHYSLPTILNSQFYGTNAVSGFDGKVNSYKDGAYKTTSPVVPCLSLHWVLRKLGELCGFRVQGEFMDDPAAQRLILYNTFALAGTTMEYRNHLPSDLTVRTLFLALKLPPFGVTSFFDVQRRTITMKYTESLLATPTRMDLTSRTIPPVLPGNILDRRIELDWELDGDDGLMKTVPDMMEKYTSDPYQQETLFTLKGKFSTLLMDAGTSLPITEQQGITALTGQMEKKFKARLLYWHGLVAGVPVAKNEYGTTRLSFHGANNLRDKFWKRYETFRGDTFPASPSISLNSSELARLDFHRTAGEEMAIHVRGVDYFVQSIKATLPLSGYSTLEVYKR